MNARVLEVLGYSCRGGAASSVIELARFLPAEGFDVTVAAPPDATFAAAITAAGARFVPVAMSGRSDWRSFARLLQLMRREPFDATFGLEATDPISLHRESEAGMATLELASQKAVKVFDDSDPDAYYDPANPMGSVRVAGTGTKIRVIQQNKNGKMTIEVR